MSTELERIRHHFSQFDRIIAAILLLDAENITEV